MTHLLPGIHNLPIGPANIRSAPELSYIGFVHSGTDQTVYTFSAEDIGIAAADRFVIVVVEFQAVTTPTLNSVTVGGVSLVQKVAASVAAVVDWHVEIWGGIVPTGATADIVCTFSGAGVGACGVAKYRAATLGSTTPDNTDTDTSTSARAATLDLTPLAGGFVICAYFNTLPAVTSVSWTEISEDDYQNIIELDDIISFASARDMNAGAISIVATHDSFGTEFMVACGVAMH